MRSRDGEAMGWALGPHQLQLATAAVEGSRDLIFTEVGVERGQTHAAEGWVASSWGASSLLVILLWGEAGFCF